MFQLNHKQEVEVLLTVSLLFRFWFHLLRTRLVLLRGNFRLSLNLFLFGCDARFKVEPGVCYVKPEVVTQDFLSGPKGFQGPSLHDPAAPPVLPSSYSVLLWTLFESKNYFHLRSRRLS